MPFPAGGTPTGRHLHVVSSGSASLRGPGPCHQILVELPSQAWLQESALVSLYEALQHLDDLFIRVCEVFFVLLLLLLLYYITG